jgi:putative ABC transport system permease protein
MKYFGLILAGLFRKPVRAWLTLASLYVAFLLFGLGQGVSQAFSAGVSVEGAGRLITQGRYSIIDLLPISHARQMESVGGVSQVIHSTWFGGVYQDRNNFFAKFPVDPNTYFEVYDEAIISPQARQAFSDTRTGVLVTSDLAERFEWSLGDRIPIIGDIWRTPDDGPWQFDLVGTFDWPEGSPNGPMMLINYDYFDEVRGARGRGAVGWFVTRLQNPDDAERVAAAIDQQFLNSENETKTATEQEFQLNFVRQIGDIGLMVTGILSAVFFSIIMVTGNTMGQSVRERIPELAVLKTLGFTNTAVMGLVLAESLLMCLIGGAVGLGLAVMLAPGIAKGLTSFLPGFALTSQAVATGFGLAVLLGLLVGILPALRAMQLSIVDALGGRGQ